MFWKNVTKVLSGTALAQLVTVLSLPVISRLLTVEEVGVYFIWLAVVSLSVVVINGRLDMALLASESDDAAAAVFRAAILFGVGAIIVIACVIIGLWIGPLASALPFRALSIFGLFLSAAALAVHQLLIAFKIYEGDFGGMARFKVTVAVAIVFVQLTLCWWLRDAEAMIMGHVLASVAVAIVYSARRIRSIETSNSCRASFRKVLAEQWRFPAFSMPADLVNNMSSQMPLFILGTKFNTAAVGSFALTNRTLAGPLGLLGGSILAVFKNTASSDYRQFGNCRAAYLNTLKTLALLALFPTLFLLMLGQESFIIVFGEEWSQAGRMAEILAPMFFMRFIASPLSYTLFVAGWQVYDLLWQLVLLAVVFVTLWFSGELMSAIKAFSIGYSMLYLVNLVMSYRASKGGT